MSGQWFICTNCAFRDLMNNRSHHYDEATERLGSESIAMLAGVLKSEISEVCLLESYATTAKTKNISPSYKQQARPPVRPFPPPRGTRWSCEVGAPGPRPVFPRPQQGPLSSSGAQRCHSGSGGEWPCTVAFAPGCSARPNIPPGFAVLPAARRAACPPCGGVAPSLPARGFQLLQGHAAFPPFCFCT